MRQPSTICWNFRPHRESVELSLNTMWRLFVRNQAGLFHGRLGNERDHIRRHFDECNKISGRVCFTKQGPCGLHFEKQ